MGIGISKMLKFYIKICLCDGQGLSGELFCMPTGLVIFVWLHKMVYGLLASTTT